MKVIRSYWKDLPKESDTLSEIPEKPMFNDHIYAYGEGSKEDIPELIRRGYTVEHVETEMYHENVYGRKLISLTMGLHSFGEVLMLDWDCIPVKPIDDKFMEYMAELPIQFPLYMQNIQNPYRCGFPFGTGYAQPNAGFVYCRDLDLGRRLIELQIKYDIQGMVDEWTMAIYHASDNVENYIHKYQPKVCYGVDRDFYDADPESEHSKLQLQLMDKIDEEVEMDIYFKHVSTL